MTTMTPNSATRTRTKNKTYDYEVIDAQGKRSKGKLEAPNEDAVASALRQQGVSPLSISEAGTGLNREIKLFSIGDRVTLKDLSIFARQFATMTSSGLSLLRALAILEEQTPKPKLAKAVRDVRLDIESGLSLSAAMAKHNKIFPRLMIAMINAGETGGFLDSALDRIAANLEKDANLRGKVKSALTYPVIVLGFSVLMIGAVLIFIVPVFSKMFKQLHAQLPLPTRLLVVLSGQAWWILPLFIALTVGTFLTVKHQYRESAAFRMQFDRFKLRLPVFGNLFRKIALSRWSRNLGTLLAVGVPIMQALDIVGETSGNAVISDAMNGVKDAVRDGQPISSRARRQPDLPADGRADDRGRRGVRAVERDAGQGLRLLRPRGRHGDRAAGRRDRTGDGRDHGRDHRHRRRGHVPADVHRLPAHPGRLMSCRARILAAVVAPVVALALVAVPAAPASANTPGRGNSYAAAAQVGAASGLSVQTDIVPGILGYALGGLLQHVVDPVLNALTSIIPSTISQLTSAIVGAGWSANNTGSTVPAPTDGSYPNCTSPWNSTDCYGGTLTVGTDSLLSLSLGGPQGYAAYDSTNGFTAAARETDAGIHLFGISLLDLGTVQSSAHCDKDGACTQTQQVQGLRLLNGMVDASLANGSDLWTASFDGQSIGVAGLSIPLGLGGIKAAAFVDGSLIKVRLGISLNGLLNVLTLDGLLGQDAASITLTLTIGPGHVAAGGSTGAWGLDLGLDLAANLSISLPLLGGVSITIPTGISGENYGNLLDLKLAYSRAGAPQASGGTWYPPGLI